MIEGRSSLEHASALTSYCPEDLQELVTVRIVLVARACAESMVSLPGIDLSKSRRQQWHVGCSASTHRGSTPLAAPCLRASITIVALRVERPPIFRQELVLALLAVSREYPLLPAALTTGPSESW